MIKHGDEVLRELERTLAAISEGDAERLVAAILEAKRVFIAGAGRTGLVVRGFAMRLMHMGLDAFVAGEIVTPGIAAGDLLLVGSGSGGTASLRAHAERAKASGAKVALATIFPDSPIGAYADVVVKIPAPTPKSAAASEAVSIQPMGSLFEQSLQVFLDITVLALMQRKGVDAAAMFGRHANLE